MKWGKTILAIAVFLSFNFFVFSQTGQSSKDKQNVTDLKIDYIKESIIKIEAAISKLDDKLENKFKEINALNKELDNKISEVEKTNASIKGQLTTLSWVGSFLLTILTGILAFFFNKLSRAVNKKIVKPNPPHQYPPPPSLELGKSKAFEKVEFKQVSEEDSTDIMLQIVPTELPLPNPPNGPKNTISNDSF